MIQDKRESLDRAILYSYQGAKIKKVGSDEILLGLMNPNRRKLDYDDKVLSIGFESGIQCGDVFEWVNTGTHWLVYLQEYAELAYFRADVRKCSYQIIWQENGEQKSTYAAIRGPAETDLENIQKHDLSMDAPNYSLYLMIPKNEDTLKQFKRYSKFFLSDICWRVEAVDTISSSGIIEVSAKEYYYNKDEDDVENGIVGGLIKPTPEPPEGLIKGETFIKPKVEYKYSYEGSAFSQWEYDKKLPLKVVIDGSNLTLKWLSTYSGQFDLKCGEEVKTIIVESLFN